jgi:hypothetical protein
MGEGSGAAGIMEKLLLMTQNYCAISNPALKNHRSIEEQMPHLMKLNAAQLVLAAGMLSFPFPAYLPYWLFGLGVLVELILAGKLASVTALLAGQSILRHQGGDSASYAASNRLQDDESDETSVTGKGGDAADPYSAAAPPPPLLEICVPADADADAPARVRFDGRPRDLEAGGRAQPGARQVELQKQRPQPRAATPAALGPLDQSLPSTPQLLGDGPAQPPSNSAPSSAPPALNHAGGAAAAAAAGPNRLDARAITKGIERCEHLHDLEDFVARHSGSFNQLHVSMALLRLHRLAAQKDGFEKSVRHRAAVQAAAALEERARGVEEEGGQRDEPAPPATTSQQQQQQQQQQQEEDTAAEDTAEEEDDGYADDMLNVAADAGGQDDLNYDQQHQRPQYNQQQPQQPQYQAHQRQKQQQLQQPPLQYLPLESAARKSPALRPSQLTADNPLLKTSNPLVRPSVRSLFGGMGREAHLRTLQQDAKEMFWFGKPRLLLYVSSLGGSLLHKPSRQHTLLCQSRRRLATAVPACTCPARHHPPTHRTNRPSRPAPLPARSSSSSSSTSTPSCWRWPPSPSGSATSAIGCTRASDCCPRSR